MSPVVQKVVQQEKEKEILVKSHELFHIYCIRQERFHI